MNNANTILERTKQEQEEREVARYEDYLSNYNEGSTTTPLNLCETTTYYEDNNTTKIYEWLLKRYHSLTCGYSTTELEAYWQEAIWIAIAAKAGVVDTTTYNYAISVWHNLLYQRADPHHYQCSCGHHTYTRRSICTSCGKRMRRKQYKSVDVYTIEIAVEYDHPMELEEFRTLVLTEQERKVYDLIRAGYNQVEVATLLGLTKGRISQIVMQIKVKADNY